MEKIKEELEKQGKTDWDIHTEFLRYVERNVRTQDRSKCSIENISNLKNGSVMVFGEGENAKYLRLSAITGDDGLPLDVYNGAEAGVRIE